MEVTAYTAEQYTAWKRGSQAALKVKSNARPKGNGRKLYSHEDAELKLPFALWTRQAIQQPIRQKFSEDMTLQGIGKYLKNWSFTIRRAYERNDERVEYGY